MSNVVTPDPNFRRNLITLLSVISVSISVSFIGIGFAFTGWLPEWSWLKKFMAALLCLVFIYAAGAMAVVNSRAQVEVLGGEAPKILGTAVLIALIAGAISALCTVLIVFKFLSSTLA
jgi:hypothetical protein